jgi:phage/plasmid-associated DNA primase
MRQEWFTFKAQFLLILVSNHLPRFMGQDEGLWRRVRLLDFRRYFQKHERVRGLADSIVSDEAEGILRWALDGAKAWYAAGRRLPEVGSIADASEEYRKDSDPIGDFLAEHVERTNVKRDIVFHSDLYIRYLIWADAAGVKSAYGSKTFSKMIDERLGKGVNHNSRPKHSKMWRLRSTQEIAEMIAAERKSVLAEASGEESAAPTEAEIRTVRAKMPSYPEPEYAVKYSSRFKLASPEEAA